MCDGKAQNAYHKGHLSKMPFPQDGTIYGLYQ